MRGGDEIRTIALQDILNMENIEAEEGILSECNCPICHVGVVEIVGYIELKQGPLEFKLSKWPPEETPALAVKMCSREPCDYVRIGAAPKSHTLAKRMLRDFMYAHRDLP
jgi:hypothetical protein